ncbi:hypothetical protein KP509_02G113600 [Ceratopteris richardii]|uniref:Uncharacterized protein n=1 Tax=Ceratopteris richardii TaxID=49495 RepID=A0A8T2VGR1_CERRI|nr:hypothetical protein KP509_02G113600 [Ceratopteris richardii]
MRGMDTTEEGLKRILFSALRKADSVAPHPLHKHRGNVCKKIVYVFPGTPAIMKVAMEYSQRPGPDAYTEDVDRTSEILSSNLYRTRLFSVHNSDAEAQSLSSSTNSSFVQYVIQNKVAPIYSASVSYDSEDGDAMSSTASCHIDDHSYGENSETACFAR